MPIAFVDDDDGARMQEMLNCQQQLKQQQQKPIATVESPHVTTHPVFYESHQVESPGKEWYNPMILDEIDGHPTSVLFPTDGKEQSSLLSGHNQQQFCPADDFDFGLRSCVSSPRSGKAAGYSQAASPRTSNSEDRDSCPASQLPSASVSPMISGMIPTSMTMQQLIDLRRFFQIGPQVAARIMETKVSGQMRGTIAKHLLPMQPSASPDAYLHCVLWDGQYYISSYDIIKVLKLLVMIADESTGRMYGPLELDTSSKKFEENVFSVLRQLKVGQQARLEEARSDMLDWLQRHHCIRTQKKQKVFFWKDVDFEQLAREIRNRCLRQSSPVYSRALMAAGIQQSCLTDDLVGSTGVQLDQLCAADLRDGLSSSHNHHLDYAPFSMYSPTAPSNYAFPPHAFHDQSNLPKAIMESQEAAAYEEGISSGTSSFDTSGPRQPSPNNPQLAPVLPNDLYLTDHLQMTTDQESELWAQLSSGFELFNQQQQQQQQSTGKRPLMMFQQTAQPYMNAPYGSTYPSQFQQFFGNPFMDQANQTAMLYQQQQKSQQTNQPSQLPNHYHYNSQTLEDRLNVIPNHEQQSQTLRRPQQVSFMRDDLSRIPPPERKYYCPQESCGRHFKRLEHLKRHQRTHTGEKPFVCPVKGCGKRFSRSDNLSQHAKIHEREEAEEDQHRHPHSRQKKQDDSVTIHPNSIGQTHLDPLSAVYF